MALPELSAIYYEYENGEFPWTIEFCSLPLFDLLYEVEVTELQCVRWRGRYQGIVQEIDAMHLLKYCWEGCKGPLPPRFIIPADDGDVQQLESLSNS